MGRNDMGPFKSIRDYLDAVDHHKLSIHIEDIDQDNYEATGLIYKLVEKHGVINAPVVFFDKIKSSGKTFQNASIGNLFGKWELEALALGVPIDPSSPQKNYQNALNEIENHIDENGSWPTIEPKEIPSESSPCKENILNENEIDLFDFPFLKTNPGDNGQYINTGSVILQDKELGRNVGTYRCQIKDTKKIGVNPQINQDGWKFLKKLSEQGEKFTKAAIVLGIDPITFSLSGSKVAKYGEDELGIAGGLMGEAIEIVKCETSDIHVPAHAELIIEGEIPLNQFESEGPFGEMYGYLGAEQKENFFLNVNSITYRNNPIIPNQFTGITRGCLTAPIEGNLNRKFRDQFDEFVALHYPLEYPGFCFVKIKDSSTERALEIGESITTALKISKITVLLDEDVDIHNLNDVLHAIGSRWQPKRSSKIVDEANGLSGDPSSTERGKGSRIIINATRNATEQESGKPFPKMNIEILKGEYPNVLEAVEIKFKQFL